MGGCGGVLLAYFQRRGLYESVLLRSLNVSRDFRSVQSGGGFSEVTSPGGGAIPDSSGPWGTNVGGAGQGGGREVGDRGWKALMSN